MYNDGGNDVNLRAYLNIYLWQLWSAKFNPKKESILGTEYTNISGTAQFSSTNNIAKVLIASTITVLANTWVDGPPPRGLYGYFAWQDQDGFWLPLQKIQFPNSRFDAPGPQMFGFGVWLNQGVFSNIYEYDQPGQQYTLPFGFGGHVNPVLAETPF